MRDRVKGILRQLRALFFPRRVNRELEAELEFHLSMATEEYLRQGMDPEEARRMAAISFGGVERYAERVREARWTRWLEDLVTDVRLGVRALARRPVFAASVTSTLGLGIGGTTAIFSVVDGLFLRAPEGVVAASEVRRLFIVRDEGTVTTPQGGPGSWVDYEAMREATPAFSALAAYAGPLRADLGRGENAERVRALAVSANYFELLGVQPALGRLFVQAEYAGTAPGPVALIAHGLWQRRYGGARDVLGQVLVLNGVSVEIVGVMPSGYRDLNPDPVDVWMPVGLAAAASLCCGGSFFTSPLMAAVQYVARLAPGAEEAVATGQAAAALGRAAEGQPLDPTPGVLAMPLTLASTPGGTGTERVALWLVLVAALVLVIASANVVNLLLTRTLTRHRELAVRLALGAGRWPVSRQQATESLLLALLGGALGVGLAWAGVRLLGQFPLPPTAGRVDARLLLFVLGVSLLTGLFVAVLPAIRSVRLDPAAGLRGTRAAGSTTHSRVRRALVALQVSISLVLVVGAGLFAGSLRQVNRVDPGVDLDRLLLASVDLRRAGWPSSERERFYERALTRVSALPDVERAAMIHFAPFDGSAMGVGWQVPGRTAPVGSEGPYLNLAGPGYFETAGTRLLAGRTFDETDRPGSEPVAVINEAMARLIADDANVVGLCVPFRNQVREGGCTRIIGVVETQRHRYLEDRAVPMVFLARSQAPDAIPFGAPALLVRTRTDPAESMAAVRREIIALGSDLPFVLVQPLSENVRRAVLPFRLAATLFGLFALLALSLAALGLYGVLAYFVTERTAEIGIRRSLGAPLPDVITLVLRQGMVPVAIGVAAGLALALAGTRFLAAILFGVDARDPRIFAAAAAFLFLIGALASLIPALRAARVQPMIALRLD